MKRKETEEKILSLSFGMVIFPAHILTVAMRTSSWGTIETGEASEEGERWEARRDVRSDLFFSKRGDRRGKKGRKMEEAQR